MPILFAVAYVARFGVNVVTGDQWEMVVYFQSFANGTLSPAELWAPHNEHRFFFPRGVMLGLGLLTGWNSFVEMYVILLCLLAALSVMLLAFERDLGRGRLLFFVPVAFLVFSFRQWTNLLWGYQITFALTLAAAVCAMFLLHLALHGSRPKLSLAGAMAAAAVAAGSSIQGLLVFPAALVQFFAIPRRDGRWGVAGLWTAFGAASWAFYFWNYDRRGSSPSTLTDALAEPVTTLRYFLSILGNSLLSRPNVVMLAGLFLLAALLIASVHAYRTGKLRSCFFWLSLTAFSLLTLLSITAGRSGIGLESAGASRYTTFSILAVASLYVVLVKLFVENRTRWTAGLLGTMLLVIAVSVSVSYWNGIRLGAADKAAKTDAAAVLADHERRSDAALAEALNYSSEVIKEHASTLDELGYNVFSGEPSEQTPDRAAS